MVEERLPRFLTPLEVKAMFEAAKDKPRDIALLKCLFYLGLRNAEAQKLDIGDIDLINETVKVVQGKGKKERYVPIPTDDLVVDLRKAFSSRTEGPLFTISDRHIRRIVKEYARKAGVRKHEEIHPHTLRHSYATLLQNNGMQLNAIQRVLGHKNIETTTLYIHLGIDNIKAAVKKAFEGF